MTHDERKKFEYLAKRYQEAQLQIGSLKAEIFVLQLRIESLKTINDVLRFGTEEVEKPSARPGKPAHLTIIR